MWRKVFVKALPNTVTSLINSCLAVSLPDNICISNAQYYEPAHEEIFGAKFLSFERLELAR